MSESAAIIVVIYLIYAYYAHDYFLKKLFCRIYAIIKWICTRNPLYLMLIGLVIGVALSSYAYWRYGGERAHLGFFGYPVLIFSGWTLLAYIFSNDKARFNRAMAKPFTQSPITTAVIGAAICLFMGFVVDTPWWVILITAMTFAILAAAKYWWRNSESAQELRDAYELGELYGEAVGEFIENPLETTVDVMNALAENYDDSDTPETTLRNGDVASKLNRAFGTKGQNQSLERRSVNMNIRNVSRPQQLITQNTKGEQKLTPKVRIAPNNANPTEDPNYSAKVLLGIIIGFVATGVLLFIFFGPLKQEPDKVTPETEAILNAEIPADTVVFGEYVYHTLKGYSTIKNRRIPIVITFNYDEENNDYTDCVYRNLTCTDGDGAIDLRANGNGNELHMYGTDTDGSSFEVHLTRSGSSYNGFALLNGGHKMIFTLQDQGAEEEEDRTEEANAADFSLDDTLHGMIGGSYGSMSVTNGRGSVNLDGGGTRTLEVESINGSHLVIRAYYNGKYIGYYDGTLNYEGGEGYSGVFHNVVNGGSVNFDLSNN